MVLVVKTLPARVGDMRDLGSIPESGRSPGGRYGNPLQYSCLEKPHGQRSLVGCSPRGRKESDTTERLHFTFTSLTFCHKGGVICISEVIDISSSSLDSACASSNPAFLMIYSAYKLNKQRDNI